MALERGAGRFPTSPAPQQIGGVAAPNLPGRGGRRHAGVQCLPAFVAFQSLTLCEHVAGGIDEEAGGILGVGERERQLLLCGVLEVDAGIPKQRLQRVAIEAKWVSSGWRAEARAVEGKFHAGLLANRTVLDTTKRAWALPAPVVALLLE